MLATETRSRSLWTARVVSARGDLGLAAALTLVHLAWVRAIQPRIAFANGWGPDGTLYHAMASTKLSSGGYPYSIRIGVPLLARHFLFSDIALDFDVISILFGVLFSVLALLLVARAQPGLSPLTKVTAWALLCMTQLSPIVFSAWYPVHVDTVFNALALLLFFALVSGVAAPLAYFALFFCGTLVRENFPLFATLVLVACRFAPVSRPLGAWLGGQLRANRRALRIVAAAAAGTVVALAFSIRVAAYNPLTVQGGSFVFFLERRPLVAAAAALVNVFGPAIVFYLLYRAQARAGDVLRHPLRDRRWQYFAPALAIVVVALGGGGNVERYLFWALPVVVFWLTPSIDVLVQRRRRGPWVFGIVFMLVFQRALLPIDPRGSADCSLRSIVTGTSTWIGNWIQFCPAPKALNLLAAFAVVCLVAAAVSAATRDEPAAPGSVPS